jgi:hypothetical protein
MDMFSAMGNKRIPEFTNLAKLGFAPEEIQSLFSREGFLHAESRGGRTYYKLRYRRDGRQRVKYVAAVLVPAIRAELQALQQNLQLRREIAALERHARRVLRDVKRTLQPVLGPEFRFHGQAIRQRRIPAHVQLSPCAMEPQHEKLNSGFWRGAPA